MIYSHSIEVSLSSRGSDPEDGRCRYESSIAAVGPEKTSSGVDSIVGDLIG